MYPWVVQNSDNTVKRQIERLTADLERHGSNSAVADQLRRYIEAYEDLIKRRVANRTD